MNDTPARNKPAQVIGIWPVQAAIWRNVDSDGDWYNVTVDRVYKDADGKWGHTNTFSLGDLLNLAKVLDIAHTWILTAQQKARTDSEQKGN